MSLQSVCLRRLAGGQRSGVIGLDRFLANPRVTAERLVAGWGDAAREACAGRHVLAVQDTSEINFRTGEGRRKGLGDKGLVDRGLGETGKGSGRGLLLHAMLGVDADSGGVLGLVAGRIWTRTGRVRVPHAKRRLADKESRRWLETAEAAKPVLSRAATVTEVSDREGDIYAKWATVPDGGFHVLTRAMKDRRTVGGGKLSTAALRPAGEARVDLRARDGREARVATLAARFGRVALRRPRNILEKDLPPAVEVSLVEVSETGAPPGAEPVRWRLLTTHRVEDAAMAWQVVSWYRMRWTIEQFFRTLKRQGLRLEDSQLESAERLAKLTAAAARAACVVMQMVQARDGKAGQGAQIAFTGPEVETLEALLPGLEGKTALQKNPHPRRSLAWATWIVAKLGGWDGYPKSRPPGPITLRNGYERFKAIAEGWSLRDA